MEAYFYLAAMVIGAIISLFVLLVLDCREASKNWQELYELEEKRMQWRHTAAMFRATRATRQNKAIIRNLPRSDRND